LRVNAYDFDKTIYRGDSSVDFYRWCIARHPRALLDLFGALPLLIGLALGRVEKTRAKQRFYRYLLFVPDVEAEVSAFWQTHERKLKRWYLDAKRGDDIVISASPVFLLQPVCDRLGVRLIASRVEAHTGVYDGLNCHDEEKVRRLREAFPDTEIDRFYSDSRSDAPMARIAREAYFVRDDALTPFPL